MTTLTSAIAVSGTTTFTVASATSFPVSGSVLIDDEILTYTSISSNTFTVGTRGTYIVSGAGTTVAAAHAVGASVRVVAGLQPASNATLEIIGGDTRIGNTLAFETPDIAVIYLNTNDSNWNFNSVFQANLQALIKAFKYGAVGDSLGNEPFTVNGGQLVNVFKSVRVATPANLPANGKQGMRWVCMEDTSSTGGVAASNYGDATTITTDMSSNAQQTVWEYRNPLAGEKGWGRVAVASTTPTHVKRIIVMGTHYRNWSSSNTSRDQVSGANTNTSGSGGTIGLNSDINTKALAAVVAENVTMSGNPSVIFTDLYNFQRSRIDAGTDPNFSGGTTYDQATSWHVADGNNHHNDYGHWLVNQAILNGGTNGTALPAAWVTALSS
jgi:hypothetical protein